MEVDTIDITAPTKEVEIQIAAEHPTGIVIWVNVDGICRLRLCRVKDDILRLNLDDKAAFLLGRKGPKDDNV